MTARTERRAANRREINRQAVNQASKHGPHFSVADWDALDRNERHRLVGDARDAVNRVDDGLARPGDDALIAVFDRHTQWDTFVWPEPLCVHGNTKDCNPCYLDHDDLMRRAEDQ